jgi:putative membrane protein insertion efficiency factor
MTNPVTFFVLQLLRAYKWAVSPLLPPSCRFVPTCSEFAMEAVERHGALRGGWMAMGRLLRCHPLARGGYDPVVRCELVRGRIARREKELQRALESLQTFGASAPGKH